MKKITIFICLLAAPISLFGLIGRCIDNSKHLQERYDNKAYHFVTCYCDCSDTLKVCPKCNHKHMAREQIIVQTAKSDRVGRTAYIKKDRHPIATTDPYIALTALVKSHKQAK